MTHAASPPTALLVIDVQCAFDEMQAAGRQINHPEAVARIVDLLTGFRHRRMPIFHIRHVSNDPQSLFAPGKSGCRAKVEVQDIAGEPVLIKHVNSAFIGTDLEARLRQAGIQKVVICGATTNHCVETTTRMAGNLGFQAQLVRDATWTFDRVGPDGDVHLAADIHAMSLANLHEEFAEIVWTREVLARLAD